MNKQVAKNKKENSNNNAPEKSAGKEKRSDLNKREKGRSVGEVPANPTTEPNPEG